MTYLGIGSPIPTLKTLREAAVTLNYPVASACEQDNTAVAPSIKEPAGGTFSATPSGLSIDSNGVITPSSSTVGTYTVLYTASGSSASFTFDIVADKASGFSYGSSSLQQSGYATPTFDSGVESGGTFTYSSSNSGNLSITQNQNSNDNGRIDLSNSDIDTYSISYTSPGPCSTTTTISLEIVAAYASTSSFYFDGVNDIFDLGTTSVLEFSNDFTISAWVKFTEPLSRGIFCCNKRDGGSGWQLAKNNAGKAWFYAGERSVYSTTSINDGAWHHIACTFERDSSDPSYGNRIEIFINGVSENVNGRLSTLPINYNLTPIYKQIGFPYVNSNYWKGYIDEVSAWDTVLSSNAITEIFNEQEDGSGKPNDLTSLTNASSSNLVAWYKM